MRKLTTAGLALGLASAVAGGVVATASAVAAPNATVVTGPDVYVLTTDNVLSRFGRTNNNPFGLERRDNVRGLLPGEDLIGLDTRPATGQLYALSDQGRLYTLNGNARAFPVGSGPIVVPSPSSSSTASPAPTPTPTPQQGPETGLAIGIDFNPAVDLLRVTTADGANARVDPDTGLVVGQDTDLAYAPGDRNAGTAPQVTGLGYTNNPAATTLFGIDSALDTLVVQGSVAGEPGPVVSPNTGQLRTVGRLGINVNAINGFDVAGIGNGPVFDPSQYEALVSSSTFAQQRSTLYSVNLRTGRARGVADVQGQVVGLTFALGGGTASPSPSQSTLTARPTVD